MTHEQIAEAFVAGTPAKNRRLVTDGVSIFDVTIEPATVMATKTQGGVLIVWFGSGRSGSIARAAIRRVVSRLYGGPTPYSWVHTRSRPRTREELLAAHEEIVTTRKALGLDPIHKAGQ